MSVMFRLNPPGTVLVFDSEILLHVVLHGLDSAYKFDMRDLPLDVMLLVCAVLRTLLQAVVLSPAMSCLATANILFLLLLQVCQNPAAILCSGPAQHAGDRLPGLSLGVLHSQRWQRYVHHPLAQAVVQPDAPLGGTAQHPLHCQGPQAP